MERIKPNSWVICISLSQFSYSLRRVYCEIRKGKEVAEIKSGTAMSNKNNCSTQIFQHKDKVDDANECT